MATHTHVGYERTGGPKMPEVNGFEGSGGPKMKDTSGGFEGTGTGRPAKSEGIGEYKGKGMRPRYPSGGKKQSSYFKEEAM